MTVVKYEYELFLKYSKMRLADITEISVALKDEKTSKIRSLHKLIFGTEGDKLNRKRLRDFEDSHSN